ncbi:MAG: hypothetical protein IPG47_17920 [Thermoflexaceae bacterium]|nr:hypothetical protein [Thermoflexaceae bacterium]
MPANEEDGITSMPAHHRFPGLNPEGDSCSAACHGNGGHANGTAIIVPNDAHPLLAAD